MDIDDVSDDEIEEQEKEDDEPDVLQDITLRMNQTYLRYPGRRIIRPMYTAPNTRGITGQQRRAMNDQTGSDSTPEQLEAWSPLTPLSTGCGRERSKSVSPMKISNWTPLNGSMISNPMKRMLFTPEEPGPSPKKGKHYENPNSPALEAALNGLNCEQLMNLIKSLASQIPSIKANIIALMPLPDLKPIEEELRLLQSNIYKSLPRVGRKFSSSTDSVSYARAEVHLQTLKRFIQITGQKLKKSEHWVCVCDFVFMAWKIVKGTPKWEVDVHNEMRRQTFAFLSSQLQNAVELGTLSQYELTRTCDMARNLIGDWKNICYVIKLIEKKLKSKDESSSFSRILLCASSQDDMEKTVLGRLPSSSASSLDGM